MLEYDVIVVGAGHAGCEAACAAGNMGMKVLLITIDMTKIAHMSCNPAIGGIAKGQIVREIDALGGYTGIVTDTSMIQFRMLNKSKGAAMWSPRAQCDRTIFTIEWRKIIEQNKNIDMWQDIATGLLLDGNVVKGVITKMGVEFRSKTVIITSGTFENGKIYIGEIILKGGRISEPTSDSLTAQFNKLGIESGRMKTGTPARIDGRSINFDMLEEQPGDADGGNFSYLNQDKLLPQHSCYITYTNEMTHKILEEGFEKSPLFGGVIEGIGPRYCPSIEDKIVTFSEKNQHQLFLEPEGKDTVEYYINGFSSSLPLDVQYRAMRTIKGLENVRIFRPGYAIEYDYYPPTQLHGTLESKKAENLYFAGQVNGTTGYEEAAGQGLIAGINAALKVQGREPLILSRDSSYIGVLIDDLVTKGVDEPYRMFTSRAEHRILLRQDNADDRLTPLGISLGLLSDERIDIYRRNKEVKDQLIDFITKTSVSPDEVNQILESKGTAPIRQKLKLFELIKRPQLHLRDFVPLISSITHMNYHDVVMDKADIEVKYEGYIKREKLIADKQLRLEEVKIADNIDYNKFKSLTIEARQKLSRIRPTTIGQAARIPGVSPADISVLLVYMGR